MKESTIVHTSEEQRPRRRRPFMFGHLTRRDSQIWFASPVRAPLAGPWSLTFLYFSGLPATTAQALD